MILFSAKLAAIGDQSISYNCFGVSSKERLPGLVGDGGMTKPDTAFLKQVVISHTADGFIYKDMFTNCPVNNR